ncbi:MAG: hypothetical protein ACW99A_16785 [Candidatus Kariarchaeaceae archaeon]|jgi:hypothetical protein
MRRRPAENHVSGGGQLQKEDIKLPQTPDMAVAFLAHKENIPLVSSDMRLVEVAEQIGIPAMMNSAFLIVLIDEVTDPKDKDLLENLYDKLFGEEITYSVKSQSRYDPVVRIQKIMDSTLNVVRNQVSLNQKAMSPIKPTAKNAANIFAYTELLDSTKEVRTDISKYISILEEGNYKKLEAELKDASALLMDLATEARMAGIEEEDAGYKEAMTTIAHLLLLASAVAIGEQKLDKAESNVDLLLLFLLENDQVEQRLDIDVHLLRITLFFLTEQLTRLKFYFTPTFIELCDKRDRNDILELHRTMSILMSILANNKAEKTAIAKDISEIEYITQLGMQYITVNKIENAWLLFEQAIYMSLNSNMTGLLYHVFEVMLPLSFMVGYTFEPSLLDMMKLVKKKDKTFMIEEYQRRSKSNPNVDGKLLRKRFVGIKKLPNQFTGFLDVISAEYAEFKRIGRCIFVRAIDWQTMHLVGIVDPTLSLDEHLTIGSSLKMLEGKFRIIQPSNSVKSSRNIDILIIGNPENLKFIVRRAGQLTIAQSKVSEFDL